MNRKECLKIMVRCVAFVVVFSMLFGNATDLLMRHDDESNEIHAFYSEPEDTIDVLYVGSSPDLGHVVNNHMTVIWNRWSAIRTIKISSKNLERRILSRLSSFHLYPP